MSLLIIMSLVLEVPLLEPDSFLTLDVASDLPDDPSKMSQLLSDEKCTLKWWASIASAYYRLGDLNKAVVVATNALQSPAAETESCVDVHCLLSSLTLQQMRQAELSGRTELYDRALDHADNAIRESENKAKQSQHSAESLKSLALAARGAVFGAVGNTDTALPLFHSALELDSKNLLAQLGHARVLYSRKSFKNALRVFQTLLPQCPKLCGITDIRIGIGLCYWHLQDKNKACAAWERSLAVNGSHKPCAAVAHSLLGVHYLNSAYNGPSASFSANYTSAMHHFQQGYTLGQVSFNSLKIAAYLYSKQDMDKVKKLILKVITNATLPTQLAEARFWEGRTAHYANDLVMARQFYAQAVEADESNPAASIGKGIVEWLLDSKPESLLTFEQAANKHKKTADVFLYCGLFSFLSQTKSLQRQAKQNLQTYFQLCKSANEPPRFEALIAMSSLYETERNFSEAYSMLKQAIASTAPSSKMLLNAGVLAFQLNLFKESLDFFNQAQGVDEKLLQYNIARVEEELGNKDTAQEIYLKLQDMDSKARMIILSNPAECINDCLSLLTHDSKNLELRALMAYIYGQVARSGKSGAREAAQREQELHTQTLKEISKHDIYTLVLLGNIYLRRAEVLSRTDPARLRSFTKAAELYTKALQIDRNCSYAAQGLAIVLAETKHSGQALPIFSRCRETISSFQTQINTAHCHVELQEFKRATELYTLAYEQMKEIGEPAGEISTLVQALARCWALSAMKSLDLGDMLTSLNWAAKACDLDTSPLCKTNHALLQLYFSEFLLQLRSKLKAGVPLAKLDCKSVLNMENAVDQLKLGIETLKNVSTDSLPYSKSDLESKIVKAELNLESLERDIEEQKEEDFSNEKKRKEAQQIREAEIQRIAEQEEEERQARLEDEKRLATEREKLQEQARVWEMERQQSREFENVEKETKKADRKRKSKKKRQESDEENDSDRYSESETEVVRKKAIVDDSEEEDYDAETKPDDNAENDNADADDIDDLF